jgi:uncharacterized protein YbjQ (UPF0145 family)
MYIREIKNNAIQNLNVNAKRMNANAIAKTLPQTKSHNALIVRNHVMG